MSDLFISYASEDRSHVQALVKEFEDQGWTVWWDRYIDTGSSFDRRIEQALDESSCVVVVWSEASIGSDWVRAEAAEGLERNILVPILLDEVKPPLLFRQKQAVSLIEWKQRGGTDGAMLNQLLPSIASVLKSYADSSLPVSMEHAWVLGRASENGENRELAEAMWLALSHGLSYLEDLFLYEASFEETGIDEYEPRDLQKLVDEEGLDGYIHSEIFREDGVPKMRVNAVGKEETVETVIVAEEHVAMANLTELIVDLSAVLQGRTTEQSEAMRAYLARLSIRCLSLYCRTIELAQKNSYQDIKRICQQVLEENSNFWPAYRALAVACIYLGQEEEARQSMSNAVQSIKLESRKSQHFARGVYYSVYSQDYLKAADEFEALLKLSPLDVAAINNLAVCRYYQLEFEAARELAKRDLQLYPGKLVGVQNAAFYSMYANDIAEAEEFATSVLEKDQAFVSSVMIRALASASRGEIAEADRIYHSYMGVDQSCDALILQGLADLAIANDEAEKAQAFLDRGVELDRANENHEHLARKLLMQAELAVDDPQALVAASLETSVSTANLMALIAFCIEHGVAPPGEAIDVARRKTTVHARVCAQMLEAIRDSTAGNVGSAIEHALKASSLLDLWLIHYCLMFIYQRADMLLEVQDEVGICLERSGEGLCYTLDEQPSFRQLATVRRISAY